jgi:4-alpha-glucanotransferase
MWYSDVQPGDALPPDYATHFPDNNKHRRAGVILHPTSLPGPNGIGELGKDAYAFVDWLASAGMRAWQVLPLVPPDPVFYSPYSGLDANCGNPLLISLEALMQEGLLEWSDAPAAVPIGHVDYPAVAAVKMPLLQKAARRMLGDGKFAGLQQGMAAYRQQNPWVEESALFDIVRQQPGLTELAWWDWPEELRLRRPEVLAKARAEHGAAIEEFVALQYLFDKQWLAIRAYANTKGVKLIGGLGAAGAGPGAAGAWRRCAVLCR